MMMIRIKLTPIESYFLGGERIFEIGSKEKNKHYFIRSLDKPTQTTLFGILRFIGVKDSSLKPEDNEKIIGANSFNLLANDIGDKFGMINNISSLYLVDNNENYYIQTPFDHKSGDNNEYTPFSEYKETIIGYDPLTGIKITNKLPQDYNPKQGLADSWTCITKGCRYGKTYNDFIDSDVHIGIGKTLSKKSFVKKEFKRLKKDYSFVFFADIDDSSCEYFIKNIIVQPGFNAEVEKNPMPEIHKDLWGDNSLRRIYAKSDIYLCSNKINELYDKCDFVCVKTKSFRGRTTYMDKIKISERYKRYEETVTLIQAGSIFIPKEGKEKDIIKIIECNEYIRIAGFNHIEVGGY